MRLACWRWRPRHLQTCLVHPIQDQVRNGSESSLRRDAEGSTRDACATRIPTAPLRAPNQEQSCRADRVTELLRLPAQRQGNEANNKNRKKMKEVLTCFRHFGYKRRFILKFHS